MILLQQLGATLCLVVVLLHGTSSTQLFLPGKEYNYQYVGLFTTGTEKPVSYASSYALAGTLRVQGSSTNSYVAKLENMAIAMYNGRWQYFPIPQFAFMQDERLKSLQEPFKVMLTDEGKFKTLTMNDQEPEYASNMKRGLATYLQMNVTGGFDSMQIFKEMELTTMGECPTSYEITPSSTAAGFARVGKFRNHADCPEIPTRTRFGNRAFYPCPTANTRDILNSTSYAVYDISFEDKHPLISKVTVLSSILYWPFTSGGQFLYTWYNVTLALTKAGTITSTIADPENAENHEDLSFVFEQSDYQDPEEETPDLKTVEPFFFHQTVADTESETMEALIAKAKEDIQAGADSLQKEIDSFQHDFHSNSPIAVSKSLSYLDYDLLKQLFTYYNEKYKQNPEMKTQFQMYIDGLIFSGTSATAMTLRDIIVETEDSNLLSKILPIFHNYIRVPSETLVKEFDTVFELIKKPNVSHTLQRTIEFSIANLASRGCEKQLCTNSGLLQKYIDHFEAKLSGPRSFEEQTAAVLGLRNLRVGQSLDKLLDIAVGNISINSTVRIQAIWSLRPMFFKDSEKVTQTLLRVFYNRKESSEVRTSVFGLIMSAKPNQRILHEIAYFMWSETCPQTLNIVRSTLTHMSKGTGPCMKLASFARTVLKYLPPGKVHATKTTAYASEYFDDTNGFGRSFYATIQKSGKAVLPVSIYFGASHSIGGYAGSPVGVFIRLQGLEKALYHEKFSVANIAQLLSNLRVTERPITPLRLELTLLYLDKVVYYFAADEQTISGPAFAQAMAKFGDLQKSLNVQSESSMVVGEVLYQQPLEVGIPVSIYTAGASMTRFKFKSAPDIKPPKSYSVEINSNVQTNIFATTTISNHVPVLGTIHTAGLLRTLRAQDPRRVVVSGKFNEKKINLTLYPQSVERPYILQTHATAFTSISGENPVSKDSEELLRQTCPTCSDYTFVTKGPGSVESNQLMPIPYMDKGLRGGVKKFMCEKDISKGQLAKIFRSFLSTEGKNTGIFDSGLTKLVLTYYQAVDYFLYWPNPEPCGFALFQSKNFANASHILEKVDWSISFDYDLVDAATMKFGTFKIDHVITSIYEGTTPPKIFTLSEKVDSKQEGYQQIQVNGTLTGAIEGYTWVGCVDISNYANVPEDPLGFEGDNEPGINQSLKIKVGKVVGEYTGNECLEDQVDLTVVGVAGRSKGQIEEVGGQSQELEYILCQMERQSGNWPKDVVPPTFECQKVAMDQTALQKVNFTIKYKISPEIRKGLIRPLLFIGSMLSPFLVDQDKVHPDHEHTQITSSKSQAIGEIEIDMDLRKNDPVMDIHSRSGSDEELHYHNVDLDLIPNSFKFQPPPSRFTYLQQLSYNAGFVGSCSVTPNYVVTLDNLKYAAKLGECETLLVADCSAYPKFAVSGRMSTDSSLIIGVQLREDQIQITKEGIAYNGSPFDSNSNGRSTFTHANFILKQQGNELIVKSPLLGIEVRYVKNGFVQIILDGAKHRGITCGLCGNFDTTSSNDFQGPSAPLCPLSSMVTAWTNGTCDKLEKLC